MKESFKEYTEKILNEYLKLRQGDALSVNTEEVFLEQAKYLANKAIEITGANVKIVVTENGKPSDVIEFDSPQQLTTQLTGLAMVRIVGKTGITSENPDDITSGNLPFIHKLGHLAEPLEIGRRIVVPWCVINPDYDLNRKEPQVTEIEYRKSYLRHWDIHKLFFKGENTDFSIEVPEDIYFIGGLQELSNSRTYLTGSNWDRLSFAVDKNSLNGRFLSNCSVAGMEKEIEFEFSNGKMTFHTPDSMLDKILSLDDEISLAGLISMRDGELILSLGGSDTQSLPELPETEEEIPEWFNTSLYTVKCRLENEVCVTSEDCEGKTRELIRKGFFVE